MPPEGHLRGAGPPTSCDAAVGLTASLYMGMGIGIRDTCGGTCAKIRNTISQDQETNWRVEVFERCAIRSVEVKTQPALQA